MKASPSLLSLFRYRATCFANSVLPTPELPRNKTATATVSGNTGASERIRPFLPSRVPNVFARPISKFFQTGRKARRREGGRIDRDVRHLLHVTTCYRVLRFPCFWVQLTLQSVGIWSVFLLKSGWMVATL